MPTLSNAMGFAQKYTTTKKEEIVSFGTTSGVNWALAKYCHANNLNNATRRLITLCFNAKSRLYSYIY